jgi:hypothetical protein
MPRQGQKEVPVIHKQRQLRSPGRGQQAMQPDQAAGDWHVKFETAQTTPSVGATPRRLPARRCRIEHLSSCARHSDMIRARDSSVKRRDTPGGPRLGGEEVTVQAVWAERALEYRHVPHAGAPAPSCSASARPRAPRAVRPDPSQPSHQGENTADSNAWHHGSA